jgi:hypothetical protein
MDSVLEVLGIFLRLFIAWGVFIGVYIAVWAVFEAAGFNAAMAVGASVSGYVFGCFHNWVVGK